jgi:hypothetical protein
MRRLHILTHQVVVCVIVQVRVAGREVFIVEFRKLPALCKMMSADNQCTLSVSVHVREMHHCILRTW